MDTKRENAKRERRHRRQRRQIRENLFFVAYLTHTHTHTTTTTIHTTGQTLSFLLFSSHTCPSVNSTTCVSLFFSFPFSSSLSSKHSRRGANRFVPWVWCVCVRERRNTIVHAIAFCVPPISASHF